MSYASLSQVEDQWPLIGRSDLYYGGTTYDNQHGLGVTLPLQENAVSLAWPTLPEVVFPRFGLLAVPVTRLYDHGTTLLPSELLKQRIPSLSVTINPSDAERLHISEGVAVRISPEGGSPAVATIHISPDTPEHVMLAPRSYGLAIEEPVIVEILLAERAVR
jgi:NADH-quinone oxidoreductase subunit G